MNFKNNWEGTDEEIWWDRALVLWKKNLPGRGLTMVEKHCLKSYVYWTVHHLDSFIKRDQLDVTCFFISLFNAQHNSDVNIHPSSGACDLWLICWVISWVVLFWYDACWCYVLVWLYSTALKFDPVSLGKWSPTLRWVIPVVLDIITKEYCVLYIQSNTTISTY